MVSTALPDRGGGLPSPFPLVFRPSQRLRWQLAILSRYSGSWRPRPCAETTRDCIEPRREKNLREVILETYPEDLQALEIYRGPPRPIAPPFRRLAGIQQGFPYCEHPADLLAAAGDHEYRGTSLAPHSAGNRVFLRDTEMIPSDRLPGDRIGIDRAVPPSDGSARISPPPRIPAQGSGGIHPRCRIPAQPLLRGPRGARPSYPEGHPILLLLSPRSRQQGIRHNV